MTDLDPEDVIEETERQKETIRAHFLPAVEWFLEEGGMGERSAVVGDLSAHLDVDEATANLIVGHLVSDEADPVQQVVQPKGSRFVGVIDHAEHDWFYAYDRYDDVDGRERRAVCGHCVHEERAAADVTHFTRAPADYDVESARLGLALHYHVDHAGRALSEVVAELGVDPSAFAERHDVGTPEELSLRDVTRRLDSDPALDPGAVGSSRDMSVPDVDVEPGASLVSGTTIGGNASWHAGNDGAGTGLDADRVDDVHAGGLDRFLNRTRSGQVEIASRHTGSETIPGGAHSTSVSVSVQPTTSKSLAFLEVSTSGGGGAAYPNLIERNGSTIGKDPGILVSDVTTSDTFTFNFHILQIITYTATFYGSMAFPEVLAPRT